MKSGDQNRFSKGLRDRARELSQADLREGGLDRLDVEGRVTREGDRPLEVELYGRRFAFEDGEVVVIEGRRWQLVKLDGKDALVPI